MKAIPKAISALIALAFSLVIAEHIQTDRLQQNDRKADGDVKPSRRCTAIGVDSAAMLDGSSVTTHNNDCQECDIRITHVPARDWPEGSMRPITAIRVAYPRYLELPEYNIHGPEYLTADMSIYPFNYTLPIGFIPQVRHTYGYTLGAYAIMNEKQVSIGESTCSAKLYALAVGQPGGKALLNMIPLTEIALERCDTARCAIQTMGDLAVEYGFYGQINLPLMVSAAQGEAGEALTISDKYETWMFHIMADDTGTSAVWAAQRVPKGHITVCPNQFVIGEMDLSDKENYLASSNVVDVAVRQGFYDPSSGKPFNFQSAYAVSYGAEGYMATRRIWIIFKLAQPSIQLSPYTDEFGSFGYGPDGSQPYPFSVAVESPLTLESIKNMTRNNFEGTEFSMYSGMAAGPFGDPIRYMPLSNITYGGVLGVSSESYSINSLQFNRPISLWRTSYSHISLSRKSLPDSVGALTWLAQYAPHHSIFVPIYASALNTPGPLLAGTPQLMDRSSNWWVFCVLSNYISRWFTWTLEAVKQHQAILEDHLNKKSAEMENSATILLGSCAHETETCNANVLIQLQNFQEESAVYVHEKSWDFFWNMTGTYRDMYRIVDAHVDNFLYSYQYIEVERWVYQNLGYWGPPGTPPPDATESIDVLPINVPTLINASAQAYAEAYPDGFFQPYTIDCYSSKTEPILHTPSDGDASFSFGMLVVGFVAGSMTTYIFTKFDRKLQYLPLN